jgi:hypothetical protein
MSTSKKMKYRFLRGGKNFVIFGPCDLQNCRKEPYVSFESRTTFALLIEICLPRELHTFTPNHSLETLESGDSL